MWSLWFVSVIVGALSLAVMEFVILHRQHAFFEATHDSFLTFMIAVLPYVWIFTFVLMAGVAVYNLRHTRRGYRKPIWFILVSSIVLSFAIGSALHLFGVGYWVDQKLGQYLALYNSQSKLERQLWQAPTAGRLLGKQLYSTTEPTMLVIFKDASGQFWQVIVSELNHEERVFLSSGQKARLLGTMVPAPVPTFHACGAFPWIYESEGGESALPGRDERELYVARMRQHLLKREFDDSNYSLPVSMEAGSEDDTLVTTFYPAQMPPVGMDDLNSSAGFRTGLLSQNLCADLAILDRLPPPPILSVETER